MKVCVLLTQLKYKFTKFIFKIDTVRKTRSKNVKKLAYISEDFLMDLT